MHTNRGTIGFITLGYGLLPGPWRFCLPGRSQDHCRYYPRRYSRPTIRCRWPLWHRDYQRPAWRRWSRLAARGDHCRQQHPGADTITFAQNGGTIMVNFDDLDADATLIRYRRSVEDIPASRATSIAMMSRISPWKVRRSLFLLPPRGRGWSSSSHNTITGLQVQHFPFGIGCTPGIFLPGPRDRRAYPGEEQYRDRIDD